MRLLGRAAIVTGAGRGIGRAIALGYAAEGADVVLASRTRRELEEVAADIIAMERQAVPVVANISVAREVRALVETALRELGKVDILVNNAGIFIRRRVIDLTEEEWEEVLAVNLKGAFLCSKAVLGDMTRRRSGSIINVSSRLGKVGMPTGAAYCASKFGLEGFTQALAAEVKESNIAVNTLSPGRGVLTSMTSPVSSRADRSWLMPQDMVEPAIFLATQTAETLTGFHLDVLEWKGT